MIPARWFLLLYINSGGKLP